MRLPDIGSGREVFILGGETGGQEGVRSTGCSVDATGSYVLSLERVDGDLRRSGSRIDRHRDLPVVATRRDRFASVGDTRRTADGEVGS